MKDPSRLFKLDYTIKYVECDLADKRVESKPVLELFLSNHFVRNAETGGVVNIHLDEDNLDKEYKGSLIGTLHRKHNDISPTAAIGLNTYAIHRNDSGYACYVNVGTSNARIGTIMRELQVKGQYDHTHDMIMRTTVVAGLEPVKKGVIELRVDRVQMGPGVRLSHAASCLQAPTQKIEESVSSYIGTSMELESTLPDLLPNTERIRAPYDLSQSGIESTGQTFLPVSAFAIEETPPANEEYFQNSFERVMARRNMKMSDYLDFDMKEKARTMAMIICYAVQSFDYIGDAVELGNRRDLRIGRQHVGTDEFANAFVTLSGDCEDGAKAINVSLKAFIATPMESPQLREMQEIARTKYTYMMTLSVVHGAKIGDQEGWGAHMYGILVPNEMFTDGLSKSIQGKALLRQMEPAMEPVNATAMQSERLPFMFCEGTGKIDPIGYKDPILDQRRYIAMNMRAAAGWKKEIPHEEYGPSPFYYANLFAISGALFDQGINVGGFIFGTRAADGIVKRGILYTDMLQQKENFVIIPQPNIPEQTMQIMQEATALFPPPRALVLDRSKPLAGKEKHPLWDKFVSTVKSFQRDGPDTKFHPSVDCFVRPHQFNETVINMMISEAAQMDRLYDAAYEVEHITNDVYTYRVRLWVK
ncbi:MAG: hypothetical protein K2Q45_07065 [Nitrosomonas sp.]|nr:hypothetical protein [Nitrosomonas sp.]